MADTHDTIDGLLAEFRGYSAGMPASYHVTMSWSDFRRMLDRFGAAHRREKAAIEADALEVGGIVEAARKRESSKNASKNGADFGQLGDAAKLREVVERIAHMNDDGYWNSSAQICELAALASAALSAPPRNCDIGSADEQWRRFCDIEAPTCRAEDVCHCRTAARCFADWSQRPHKEGGAK